MTGAKGTGTRVIKRYESRKLYDTAESKYVSLEEVATLVRDGVEVQILDNANSDDVTAQTLTQIILDEGRNGRSKLSSSFMHDLVRKGERVVTSGVEHVQQGVGRLVKASIDRVGPLREAREEMSELRTRLDELESTLANLDGRPSKAPKTDKPAKRRSATSRSSSRKQT